MIATMHGKWVLAGVALGLLGVILIAGCSRAVGEEKQPKADGTAPFRLELVSSEPGKLEAVLHNASKEDQQYLVHFGCCAAGPQPVALTLLDSAGTTVEPFQICARVSCKLLGLLPSRDMFKTLRAGKTVTVAGANVRYDKATSDYRVTWGTNIYTLKPGVHRASAVWVSHHRDVTTKDGVETLEQVWLGRLETKPVSFVLTTQGKTDLD